MERLCVSVSVHCRGRREMEDLQEEVREMEDAEEGTRGGRRVKKKVRETEDASRRRCCALPINTFNGI